MVGDVTVKIELNPVAVAEVQRLADGGMTHFDFLDFIGRRLDSHRTEVVDIHQAEHVAEHIEHEY